LEYEQEWRMPLPLIVATKEVDAPPMPRSPLYDLPPDALRTVIFGLRMDATQSNAIIAALRANDATAAVSLFRVERDGSTFDLRLKAID
jgi:hypothetical protein